MGKRRRDKEPPDDNTPPSSPSSRATTEVEWPGRQVPTTQLTLFETTFIRKPAAQEVVRTPNLVQMSMKQYCSS